MTFRDDIARELDELRERAALRTPDDPRLREAGAWVDVCSNDYLGLGRRGVSRETLDALTGLSQGSGASRLIHGTRQVHEALEAFLAAWVGQERALAFSSGYAANVGALASLAGAGDLVLSDALNHASIIDGCRLSRARIQVVPSGDLGAVARALDAPARRRWVVVEGYYSMDGTTPDLRGLRELCSAAGAGLVVDEAHALGVLGPGGAGACAEAGIAADVIIGAFGKAVGFQGGFVAASETVLGLVWNRARSFVFSTALSPVVAQLALLAAQRAQAAEAERTRLTGICSALEAGLLERGIVLRPSRRGPIFPIVLGANTRALEAATTLRGAGFLTQAIRPPTVPANTARLRITASADLTDDEVRRLTATIGDTCAR